MTFIPLFNQASSPFENRSPVRWNRVSGDYVVTKLNLPIISDPFTVSVGSSAANMVVGATITEGGGGDAKILQWTNSTTPTAILLDTDYTNARDYPVWGLSSDGHTIQGVSRYWRDGVQHLPPSPFVSDGNNFGATMSDDGRIMVGFIPNLDPLAENGFPAIWNLAGDVIQLPFPILTSATPISPPGANYQVSDATGTTVFAGVSQLSPSYGTFWVAGDGPRLLAPSNTEFPFESPMLGCLADGSIVYGLITLDSGSVNYVYWDNLTSSALSFVEPWPGLPVDAPPLTVYGTSHILEGDLSAFVGNPIWQVADNLVDGLPLAVGQFEGHAVKWHGTTLIPLVEPVPAGGTNFASAAYGVSADGLIIVGYLAYTDLDDNQVFEAIYWDADGAHILPVPPRMKFTFHGEAFGISADGSLIWGVCGQTFTPWIISSSTTTEISSGVGDVWMDDSYVDFSDSGIRANFVTPDGAWVDYGTFGDFPTGISPLNWLTVQPGNGPEDILVGYGQNGSQSSWDLLDIGNNPITGLPYPAMSFDECIPTSIMGMDDLALQTNALIDPDHNITLRWSDDAGISWSNGIQKTLGRTGEYLTAPTWYRLGMARSRVYELSWAGNRAESLIGVFIKAAPSGS